MRSLNDKSPYDLETEMDHYKQSLPLDIDRITRVLRKQGRDVMADMVEGMADYINELKVKLEKAVKNRPLRKKR